MHGTLIVTLTVCLFLSSFSKNFQNKSKKNSQIIKKIFTYLWLNFQN